MFHTMLMNVWHHQSQHLNQFRMGDWFCSLWGNDKLEARINIFPNIKRPEKPNFLCVFLKKQNKKTQKTNKRTIDDVLQKSVECSQGDIHLKKRNMFQAIEDLIQQYSANISWDLYSKAINELDQIRTGGQNSK